MFAADLHEGSTNKVILNTGTAQVRTESVKFDADVCKLTIKVRTEVLAFKYKVRIHKRQRNTVLKRTHLIP